MRYYIHGVVLCCFFCVCLSAPGRVRGEPPRDGSVLLVVPARYRIVKLALDMHWLRSVSVVSYRGDAETTEPLLHVWTGSSWRHLDQAEFFAGYFLYPSPRLVIFVGDDKTLPSVLPEGIGWNCRKVWLKTLDLTEMLNGLGGILQFEEPEWKLIARRFELDLVEVDSYRRGINPYAIRRSELPLEALDIPGLERPRDDRKGVFIVEIE